ncbi:MAG: beta-galactosidase trimerization domain-containing protein [Chloroflexi bacterium]|nr:beta-galactosidase trimerization domain-containing protein [Chloroflexota bacterium]
MVKQRRIKAIVRIAVLALTILLVLTVLFQARSDTGTAVAAAPNDVAQTSQEQANQVVYYDARYPSASVQNAPTLITFLNAKGSVTLNADELQTWLEGKVAGGAEGSVVVMAMGIVPDTVVQTMDENALIREFMDMGGRVVWIGDVPFFYQGHADGTKTTWGTDGSIAILGVGSQDLDSDQRAILTPAGLDWGMSFPGMCQKPVPRDDVSQPLSQITTGVACSWFKNFNSTYPQSGFVRYRAKGFDGEDYTQNQDVYQLVTYPYTPKEWWQSYQPSIFSLDDDWESLAQVGATTLTMGPYIAIGYSPADVFRQHMAEDRGYQAQELHDRGYRYVPFLSTVQAGEYEVEIDEDYNMVGSPWAGYPGTGRRVKYGFQAYYDGQPWMKYAPPWSYYFAGPWQDPSGNVVTDTIEVGAVRGIDGEKIWGESVPPMLAYTYQMDVNNPYWLEYVQKVGEILVDFAADGIHLDEFNVANFYAFYGYWSRSRFRDYLQEYYSVEELAAMGIADVETFDILTYVHEENYDSYPWLARRDPVWLAYLIFQVEAREDFNRELVRHIKDYAIRRYGDDHLMITANNPPLLPVSALSAPYVDVPILEQNVTGWWGNIPPYGLPPVGKLSGTIKLSRISSHAPYVHYFYGLDFAAYIRDNFDGQLPSNLYSVHQAEALANGAMIGAEVRESGNPYYLHFPEVRVKGFNDFILRHQHLFADRQDYAKIALIFSERSQVAGFYPHGGYDEPHTAEYMGWYLALTDLHHQYVPLVAEILELYDLSQYDLVILPSTTVLSSRTVATLEAYIAGGGNLIVTHDTSLRGEDLNLLADYALAPVTGVHLGSEPPVSYTTYGDGKVVYIHDTVGAYYQSVKVNNLDPEPYKLQIQDALGYCLDAPLLETNAPETVGVTLYTQPHNRLVVNLNNYDLDVSSDQLTPKQDIAVSFTVPEGFATDHLRAFLLSPDHQVSVLPLQIQDDELSFTVPELHAYEVVLITGATKYRILLPRVSKNGHVH